MPFWRPNPLTSDTVIPDTPISPNASRTSSILKGFIIASIFSFAALRVSTNKGIIPFSIQNKTFDENQSQIALI